VGHRACLDGCGESRPRGNTSANIADMFSGLSQVIMEIPE